MINNKERIIIASNVPISSQLVEKKKMKINIQEFIVLLVIQSYGQSHYSYEPMYENQCKCQAYSKNMTSILVQDTMGQLGNKMFCVAFLYLFSVKYGFDAYTTNTVLDDLRLIFQGVDGMTSFTIREAFKKKNAYFRNCSEKGEGGSTQTKTLKIFLIWNYR